jgi:hypothetical protein
MITTQPYRINTQYNAEAVLSAKREILEKKKLMLLAIDLEKELFYEPIDCIVLTSLKVYCLSEKKIHKDEEFIQLQRVMQIINQYNKFVGRFDLNLTELNYCSVSTSDIRTKIDYVSRVLFENSHKHLMATIFGEAQYEDTPEWFRNGIWIIPSLPKSKL